MSVVSKEVKRLSDTTISCSLTGISEPVNITWSGYHEDEHHIAGPVTVTSNSQSSTLHVTSVQSDHTYTCTVSSVYDSDLPLISRDVYLDVFSEFLSCGVIHILEFRYHARSPAISASAPPVFLTPHLVPIFF